MLTKNVTLVWLARHLLGGKRKSRKALNARLRISRAGFGHDAELFVIIPTCSVEATLSEDSHRESFFVFGRIPDSRTHSELRE